jgi:hypothetical protein
MLAGCGGIRGAIWLLCLSHCVAPKQLLVSSLDFQKEVRRDVVLLQLRSSIHTHGIGYVRYVVRQSSVYELWNQQSTRACQASPNTPTLRKQ